jgi:hypothetical protein
MKCVFFALDGERVKCTRCGLSLKPKNNTPPDRVRALCVAWPRWHEWGYWTELLLEAAGISKQRWLWIRKKMGLAGPCGCENRETAMNVAGSVVKELASRFLKRFRLRG